MSVLTFATEGQAEALAAQESIRKKALEIRREFEEGAKATKTWDAEVSKLARTSDSALRSIQTEQEKIADQIVLIQERQAKGIGTTEENEAAIEKLRKKWVDVGDDTKAAERKSREYADSQAQIKSAAESALGSVQTELEGIEDKIGDIEKAAAAGLIPPAEAEEGVKRLRKQYDEVKASIDEGGKSADTFEAAVKKAFNPMLLVKFGAGVFGIKQTMAQIRREFEDLQTAIDERIGAQLSFGGKADAKVQAYAAYQAGAGPPAPQPTGQEFSDARRFRDRSAVTAALDKGFEDMARLGDPTQLTSEELKKFANVLRELGQGDLARKFTTFIGRVDDGTISIDEVVTEMQRMVSAIRQRDKDPVARARSEAQFSSEGGDVLTRPPARELSTKDAAAAAGIGRMIEVLQDISLQLRDNAGGGLGP